MRAIIKSASVGEGADAIQAFGTPSAHRHLTVSSREDLLEARIAELEAEIAKRDEAWPAELADARETARCDALKERTEAESQALKELKRTLGEAHSRWSQQLQSWESLSIGIAHAVLEQVFFDATVCTSKVASAIRYQLQILDASSVVRVRVSADDFAEAEQLSSVANDVGPGVELASDPKLKSGECTIDLNLGHVDIGLPAQWTRISQLLERLESEAGNP